MSIDVLRSIAQAERDADEIIKKSVADCRQIVSKAQDEARQLIDQMIKEAQKEGDELIAQAELAALEEVKKIEENTKTECVALQQQAREKMDLAVDIIMGRIVNPYGNS
ncbi:MAG: hypothetical protein GX066_07365 [Clostridiaceae bacterium]|nr:hypothetical protein [Clostridiaceae bacterium]